MSDANATQRMEVSGESDGESAFVARARDHELVMDDPESTGGDDAGAVSGVWTIRALRRDSPVASVMSMGPAGFEPAINSL